MPLCYGGGIKSTEQMKKIYALGVEKISISSQAVINPNLIKEAAILFESGANKDCYIVITVVSPIELRVERVRQRDKKTKAEIEKIKEVKKETQFIAKGVLVL